MQPPLDSVDGCVSKNDMDEDVRKLFLGMACIKRNTEPAHEERIKKGRDRMP